MALDGVVALAKTLKVGVVGLGVGEQHVIGYNALEGCEVTAVCDIDPEKLSAVGERNSIGARHDDYRKITENPDIDVVSICSFDHSHAEQAVSAFRHGKHVMIEKPLALHRHEAEAILQAQQESGRLLTSNLILRHSPRFRELHRMIRAGDFGDIFYLEGDYIHQILWKLTQGWRGAMDFYCVTYGGGIHLIDLMRWLMGEEITEVCGMGNQLLSKGSQYQYPDTIVSLMRFENGAMAKNLTTLGPQRTQLHALEIYGTKLTFVNNLPDAKLFRGDQPEDEEAMTVPYPAIEKSDLLPDFIAAIREGREPNVSARDVFRVMDVCLAAWESVEQRRTLPVTYLL